MAHVHLLRRRAAGRVANTVKLAEAMALPRPKRPGPGVCAGYEGENRRHDRHTLHALPLVADQTLRTTSRWSMAVERWRGINDGRTCTTCWAVYDPTHLCEIRDHTLRCEAPARFLHELGFTSDFTNRHPAGKQPTAYHDYCGTHAPSQIRARAQAIEDRKAAKHAAFEVRYAPQREQQNAEHALVAEARRWRDDEAATGDGFCTDDCEHHECRLARAVARLECAEEVLAEAEKKRLQEFYSRLLPKGRTT